jgi:hypothetical protein
MLTTKTHTAADHSITSSARKSRFGEMEIPSAFAALRLMTICSINEEQKHRVFDLTEVLDALKQADPDIDRDSRFRKLRRLVL